MGSSPRQANRLLLVEWMSTRTDNMECMRCTISSGLTPTNVTRSRPGMGSTPTPYAPGRSGSPGPSASLTIRPPRPRGWFGSEPRGLQRAQPRLLWSTDPPSPTEVAAGGPGQPWRAVRRSQAAGGITGSTSLIPGRNTNFAIQVEGKGKKWKHLSGA